jgi:hypothetical protein
VPDREPTTHCGLCITGGRINGALTQKGGPEPFEMRAGGRGFSLPLIMHA